VFNGLKGLSMVYMVWGFTFYFVWFSVISNPEEVQTMKGSIFFNVVSGVVYTVPVFFFCSGFLQTYSFLQDNDQNNSKFTKEELGKWYLRKVTRYIPLNMVAMLFTLFIVPLLGFGPIWDKFSQATAGCSQNWWTNLLWINNVYPQQYDDKCLPWTWFVPCYV
jgi:peptidoglycan/LPS O-acetylase OafA/YrhL